MYLNKYHVHLTPHQETIIKALLIKKDYLIKKLVNLSKPEAIGTIEEAIEFDF